MVARLEMAPSCVCAAAETAVHFATPSGGDLRTRAPLGQAVLGIPTPYSVQNTITIPRQNGHARRTSARTLYQPDPTQRPHNLNNRQDIWQRVDGVVHGPQQICQETGQPPTLD